MSQVITATVESGLLKPDKHLDLPAGTRVRLIVDAIDKSAESWQELEKL
jgi:predicted DNA-binding antitoxin AbrB/MazE fold protein